MVVGVTTGGVGVGVESEAGGFVANGFGILLVTASSAGDRPSDAT